MKVIGITLALVLAACGGGSSTPKGPGASLRCASSGKNAFDTYGSINFVAVNKKVFELVGAELQAHATTNLGDSFNKIGQDGRDDGPTFEGRLAAFLVFVYGGPDHITYTDGIDYDGVQDMADEHAGLAITSAQYDYFIANIVVPALTESGVPMDDVTSCFAGPVTDASFKASIVGK
jgi:hypothetical protein